MARRMQRPAAMPLGMTDPKFDRIYPAQHRVRSWTHWTPLEVAVRASALLASQRATRVLDIGSGVGKLCLVGALTTTATWFGIESDAEMVRVAKAAAVKLRVQDRTTFLHGDATHIDWSGFDAFYLFNPFGERLLGGEADALARRDAYISCVDFTQQQLAAARPGTCVVTYHGFGGDMPPGYDLVHRESAHEDELLVWVRRATNRAASPA
jgi:predicted RNA methylase